MKALVLSESLYGNTAKIARAIADGLGQIGEVQIADVNEASEGTVREADLVVVGGPTQGHGMSQPGTRKGVQGTGTGVREWLESLRPGSGKKAAAFDTRFDKPRWLTGSAALGIARKLGRRGYLVVLPPESFFVEHTEGPLREGEEDRARRWGAELARRATAT